MDATSLALQTVASLATLAAMWLMGNRTLWGPIVGVISEVAWLALILHDGLWGILPLTTVLFVVNIRNYFKWRWDA